jgi:hypothetical protein
VDLCTSFPCVPHARTGGRLRRDFARIADCRTGEVSCTWTDDYGT